MLETKLSSGTQGFTWSPCFHGKMEKLSRNQIISKDKKFVWHPYTQMKEYVEKLDPLVIEKAKGVFLYDKNGKKYYDGNSSWWVSLLGHSHPRLINAFKNQIDVLPHCSLAGTTHENAALLAEKLSKITPTGLSKVFYSDNGSTAVEVAVKMAFQYWQQNGKKSRRKFLTLENAFHGETVGATSVGGINLFHKIFSPLLFDTFKAPSPYCYRCPLGSEKATCSIECFSFLEKTLKKHCHEIAAVIIEPLVQGAAGMIVYPVEYLIKLQKLAKELDIFLIVDEVFTGFGRTGKMFAVNHGNISPDFICLSKGLSGGMMPFAATLTTERIYQGFYDDNSSGKTFYYGHSYCGNPLGAALALEVLKILKEEKVIESLEEKINLFRKLLGKFLELDTVGDVRSIGLIGAIETVEDKKNKTPFSPEVRFGKQFYNEALKSGAYLRPLGDIIYMVLPLTISNAELENLVDLAFRALKKISYLKG